MTRSLLLLMLVLVPRLALADPQQLKIADSATGIVTAFWDASTDGVTIGYRLFYGLVPAFDDNDAVKIEAGAATSVALPIAMMQAGRLYYFRVRAYNMAGVMSPPSNEVTYLIPQAPGDPCAPPLGVNAISIFKTGKLNKTGSGGAGSKAFITFQAASPNSPIVALSIRANGVDVPDSLTEGSNLRAVGSLWFTIPAGPATFTFSIYGRNGAGCTRDLPTGFTVTVP
jgi:hypothetical protein